MPEYIVQVIFANLIAVFFLYICRSFPHIARFLLSLFFFASAVLNLYISISNPQLNLEVYGAYAVEPYRSFIYGTFSTNLKTCLIVHAAFLLIVSILISLHHIFYNVGLILAGLYFFATAPLGIASAFPAPLILFSAVILLMRKRLKGNFMGFLKEATNGF